jgi:peptide/nickel transport system permease protein
MNVALSRLLPIAFILLVIVGLAGKFIAPQDPSAVDLTLRFIPPFHDIHHLLGTDQLGRDILSRTLTGRACRSRSPRS